MKKAGLTIGLLAAAFLAGPARSQVFTQAYLVQYQLQGSAPFPPELVGFDQPHTVGECDRGECVVTSQPITTIELPVSITDTSTGETATFNAVVSTVGLAASIAAFYDVPLTAEVGLVFDAVAFVASTYGPITHAVYAGIGDFAAGVINAGISAMNAGVIPIGPDPLFNFDFAVGATTFTGSFDAVGDIGDISGIHNISLSVDGIPALRTVPEPSTWAMLLIGLAGVWLVRRRAVRWG